MLRSKFMMISLIMVILGILLNNWMMVVDGKALADEGFVGGDGNGQLFFGPSHNVKENSGDHHHHHNKKRSTHLVANEEALDLLRRITREAASPPRPPKDHNNNPQQDSPTANDTPSSSSTTSNVTPKGCKYRKGTWSECDAQTKVRTRTFTLRKGAEDLCEAIKTFTKPCKGGNKKKGGKQRNSNKGRNKGAKNRQGQRT